MLAFGLVLLLGSCADGPAPEGTQTDVPPCETAGEVDAAALELRPGEGLVYYQGKPFCGTRIKRYPDGGQLAEKTAFAHGKKQGPSQKWFPDGTLSYEGGHEQGKLDGPAKTWWRNGILRSETPYKMGVVHGEVWQWYQSGAKFKKRSLVDGKEEGMQMSWRENGAIYCNYEAKNGRIFGLKRANLCYALEDEEIQYRK